MNAIQELAQKAVVIEKCGKLGNPKSQNERPSEFLRAGSEQNSILADFEGKSCVVQFENALKR